MMWALGLMIMRAGDDDAIHFRDAEPYRGKATSDLEQSRRRIQFVGRRPRMSSAHRAVSAG